MILCLNCGVLLSVRLGPFWIHNPLYIKNTGISICLTAPWLPVFFSVCSPSRYLSVCTLTQNRQCARESFFLTQKAEKPSLASENTAILLTLQPWLPIRFIWTSVSKSKHVSTHIWGLPKNPISVPGSTYSISAEMLLGNDSSMPAGSR